MPPGADAQISSSQKYEALQQLRYSSDLQALRKTVTNLSLLHEKRDMGPGEQGLVLWMLRHRVQDVQKDADLATDWYHLADDIVGSLAVECELVNKGASDDPFVQQLLQVFLPVCVWHRDNAMGKNAKDQLMEQLRTRLRSWQTEDNVCNSCLRPFVGEGFLEDLQCSCGQTVVLEELAAFCTCLKCLATPIDVQRSSLRYCSSACFYTSPRAHTSSSSSSSNSGSSSGSQQQWTMPRLMARPTARPSAMVKPAAAATASSSASSSAKSLAPRPIITYDPTSALAAANAATAAVAMKMAADCTWTSPYSLGSSTNASLLFDFDLTSSSSSTLPTASSNDTLL